MSESLDFYKWFYNISSKLGQREISFKKIFKYLDSLPSPIIIVETGCLRKKDNLGLPIKEKDIYIVTGFKPGLIKSNVNKKFKKINYIYNKYFQKKEMLYSMLLAMKKINEDFICIYSDILFSHETLNKLLLYKKNSNIKIPCFEKLGTNMEI